MEDFCSEFLRCRLRLPTVRGPNGLVLKFSVFFEAMRSKGNLDRMKVWSKILSIDYSFKDEHAGQTSWPKARHGEDGESDMDPCEVQHPAVMFMSVLLHLTSCLVHVVFSYVANGEHFEMLRL